MIEALQGGPGPQMRRVRAKRLAVVPVIMAALMAGGFVLVTLQQLDETARQAQSRQEYWIVAEDGSVFALGDSGPAPPALSAGPGPGTHHGSSGEAPKAHGDIAGMAVTSTGRGYWLAAADGEVLPYGDASPLGSRMAGYDAPVVGIEATPTGRGYWLVAADGGVFAFGDASFEGSAAGLALASGVVGLAPTPTGRGYWLVAADGGVFAFGDAVFRGSAGSLPLHRPVRGIASTADGQGYWLVAADGGVFAYGNAGFEGSTAGMGLRGEIAGMDRTSSGHGYWLVSRDGQVFALGDASFLGPEQDLHLRAPAVGVVSLRTLGPLLRIDSGPSGDELTSDPSPAWSGAASDPGGSVDEVQASVDGGPFSSDGVVCSGCGSSSATWELRPPALPDGEHAVHIRSLDEMGVASAVAGIRVVVDTKDPRMEVVSGPAAGASMSRMQPELGGTAADGSGIERVEASVDGGPFSTDGVACAGCPRDDVAWSFTPAGPLVEGTHTVRVRAVDRASNPSSEVSRSFVVGAGSAGGATSSGSGTSDHTISGDTGRSSASRDGLPASRDRRSEE